MDQPLGNFVGNALEIKESVMTLKNEGPKDLTELSLALAAHMIHIGGGEKTYNKALKRAKEALKSGAAYKEFEKLIAAQGGDVSVIKDTNKLNIASEITEIKAPKDGYIKSFQNDEIGLLLIEIGGGRKTKTDKLDLSTGFEFFKKVGDKVKAGDTIMQVYHNKNQVEQVKYIEEKFLSEVVKISSKKIEKPATIYEIVE